LATFKGGAMPVLDKPWSPPQDVGELLERCLERARVEENWTHGAWIKRKARFSPLPQGDLGCGDVQACAAGIMLIELRDGPLIRDYFCGPRRLRSFAVLLADDPIGGPAAAYVANALDAVAYGEDSHNWHGIARSLAVSGSRFLLAVDRITASNDSGGAAHERIVAGFEMALRWWREDHPEGES
jgi:hypothetical protein